MTSDPWKGIDKASGESINARRVSETLKWDLYWARDPQGRRMLLMRSGPGMPRDRLPKLRGIETSLHEHTEATKISISLSLIDDSLRDVFHKLCLDIISCVSAAKSESEAVATAIARTWRWHHLLRGGSADVLSREEQKGLIGELIVLEAYFLQSVPPEIAIESWKGPSSGVKDFVLGSIGVESKACNASRESVTITSAAQLDTSGMSNLFLHVTALDPTDEEGFTITDVVNRVRSALKKADPGVGYRYEALLAAAGYRDEDDYSHSRWRGSERAIFVVNADFPRLTPSTVPVGISRVLYDLDLSRCSAFMVAPEQLMNALRNVAI